jgi:fructose/tagatose bisphosphate aldolase
MNQNLKEVLSGLPIFAFNVDDWLIFKGVVAALENKNQPVIVQLSEGEVDWWGIERFYNAVEFEKKRGLSLFTNIDHGKKEGVLAGAVEIGFAMVHVDGSDLSWQENIEKTKRIVQIAHQKGVVVEGEPQQELTDPEKAAEFVAETNVDLLAVFVGNKHGMEEDKEERLDFTRLREIKSVVGKTKLTLHGGSGVNLEDVSLAINQGLISKVNINTHLRKVFRMELEKSISRYSGVKVYELMSPVVDQIAKTVETTLQLAGGSSEN